MSSMIGGGEARLDWMREALARQEQRDRERRERELRLMGLRDYDHEQMSREPEPDSELCPCCRRPWERGE